MAGGGVLMGKEKKVNTVEGEMTPLPAASLTASSTQSGVERLMMTRNQRPVSRS